MSFLRRGSSSCIIYSRCIQQFHTKYAFCTTSPWTLSRAFWVLDNGQLHSTSSASSRSFCNMAVIQEKQAVRDDIDKFLDNLQWQFTEKELDEILYILNTESKAVLLRYPKMTKKAVNAIVKYREENFQPEFKDVQSLVETFWSRKIRGKAVMNILNTIHDNKLQDNLFFLPTGFASPKIKMTESPPEIVSIAMLGHYLSYAVVTENLTVKEWKLHNYMENTKKQKNFMLYDKIADTVDSLPLVDTYLYFTMAPVIPKQAAVRSVLTSTYAEGILTGILTTRYRNAQKLIMSEHSQPNEMDNNQLDRTVTDQSDDTARFGESNIDLHYIDQSRKSSLAKSSTSSHCVYKVSPRQVGEHFDLWVGGNFMDGTDMLAQLHTDCDIPGEGVSVAPHLWSAYQDMIEGRYLMTQSLLTAAAFYRIGKKDD